MPSSVQFRGPSAVINAYTNNNSPFFSIWQGKQFMFKGEGGDDLKNILEALKASGTNATYTLRVYESIEELSKIKSNTPDDGSFNFVVNEYEAGTAKEQNFLFLKIKELEEKIEEMKLRDDDDEQEEKGGLGKIGEILSHPAFAQIVPQLVGRLVNFILPENKQPIAALAGISALDENIAKLKIYDEKFELHIAKLVELAETNPTVFKAIINSLG